MNLFRVDTQDSIVHNVYTRVWSLVEIKGAFSSFAWSQKILKENAKQDSDGASKNAI